MLSQPGWLAPQIPPSPVLPFLDGPTDRWVDECSIAQDPDSASVVQIFDANEVRACSTVYVLFSSC